MKSFSKLISRSVAPAKRQFMDVTLLRTYETPFRSPQPFLFPLDDAQWLKAMCGAIATLCC